MLPTFEQITPNVTISQVVNEVIPDFYAEVFKRVTPYIDGTKPVHRALLLTLLQLSNNSQNAIVSSNNLINQSVARYHNHRPRTVYMSLINMTLSRLPLIKVAATDNGRSYAYDKVTGFYSDSAYISVQFTDFGFEFTNSTVTSKKISNYDGTLTVPQMFKSLIPNYLFNTYINIGIGYKFSTLSLCPQEVFRAMQYMLYYDLSVKQLAQIIKGFDIGSKFKCYMSYSSLCSLIDSGYAYTIITCPIDFIKGSNNEDIMVLSEPPLNSSLAKVQKALYSLESKENLKTFTIIECKNVNNAVNGDCELHIMFNLNTGFTHKDIVNELYAKTNLQMCLNVSYVYSLPSDETVSKDVNSEVEQGMSTKQFNSNQRVLDKISLKEILQTHIEFGKENRRYEVNQMIEELKGKLQLNILLEKLTRPEVVNLISQCLPFKDKKERWRAIGKKYIVPITLFGMELAGGLSEDELNLMMNKGSIFLRLSERDLILAELSDYGNQMNALQNELSESSVCLYLYNKLESYLKRDGLSRETQMFYTKLDYKNATLELYNNVVDKIVAHTEIVHKRSLSEIPVTIVIYKDNSITKFYGIDDIKSEEAKLIWDCTLCDDLVIITTTERKRLNVSEILDVRTPLSYYCKGDFQTILVQELECEDIEYLFVTSLGRVKRLSKQEFEQTHESVQSFSFKPNEVIINTYAISRKDNYSLEVLSSNGFKRITLSNIGFHRLKGYKSLYAETLKQTVLDSRLIQLSCDEGTSNGAIIDNASVIHCLLENCNIAAYSLNPTFLYRRAITSPFAFDSLNYKAYLTDKAFYYMDKRLMNIGKLLTDIDKISNSNFTYLVPLLYNTTSFNQSANIDDNDIYNKMQIKSKSVSICLSLFNIIPIKCSFARSKLNAPIGNDTNESKGIINSHV